MSLYKGRYVLIGGGLGRRANYTILPWLWQASWFPLSTTISNIYRWSWTWWFSARAQMKRVFHQHKLNPGHDETKAEFSRNCIVPLKFVKDYVYHLAQIEMRKEKRRAESERQKTQRLEKDYNNTEWEELYNSDQISSLKVHELNLYLVRHVIVFKRKKPEKVTYIKYISLAGSYQAWRKGLHCVKKLQLWAQKVMKRKGLEVLKHCQRHRENWAIYDSPVLHTVDTSTSRYGRKRTRVVRRPRQLLAIAEQEEKRKKERVNESDKWTVIKLLFNSNLE